MNNKIICDFCIQLINDFDCVPEIFCTFATGNF
jgi:hypothetical protein